MILSFKEFDRMATILSMITLKTKVAKKQIKNSHKKRRLNKSKKVSKAQERQRHIEEGNTTQKQRKRDIVLTEAIG